MSDKFKKLIELISRTGDKLIIYDPREELEPFVLLSLDEYERFLNTESKPKVLTETYLSDKISNDIETWQKKSELIENKPKNKEKNHFQISTETEEKVEYIKDFFDDSDDSENDEIAWNRDNETKDNFAPISSILESRAAQFQRVRKSLQNNNQ